MLLLWRMKLNTKLLEETVECCRRGEQIITKKFEADTNMPLFLLHRFFIQWMLHYQCYFVLQTYYFKVVPAQFKFSGHNLKVWAEVARSVGQLGCGLNEGIQGSVPSKG